MVACALLTSLALAQEGGGGGVWSPEEQAVLAAYDEHKLLTARRLAEELLTSNPASIPGNYVMGSVDAEAEGNLALAMRHFALARERYEETLLNTPGDHWKMHANLLTSIATLAGAMEQERYQIQILDYHDSLYDPNLTGEHAWPYMKLGELDEAQRYAQLAIETNDPWEMSAGHNAACAIESTLGTRSPSHAACMAALDFERVQQDADINVAAFNASLTALSVFDFAQAEALAKESAEAPGAFANPWLVLSDLYLTAGRGAEAVSASQQLQRWRARQPPRDRSHGRAQADAGTARVLLVAGETEAGLRLANRALQFPDRMGNTSMKAEAALGGHSLLRLALRRADDERFAEEVATRGWLGRVVAWFGSWLPTSRDWQDRAAVRTSLADTDRLLLTLRPYLDGRLDAPTWLAGDIVDVVGAGVVQEALNEARGTDTELPVVHAYFDAIQVEIDRSRGRWASVATRGPEVAAALPTGEALLRARIFAWSAEASWRQGDQDGAYVAWEQALRLDPGVGRRLGLALPAQVLVLGGGDQGAYVGDMLSRSPRLQMRSGGFQVTVDGGGQGPLEVCLRSPTGAVMRCVHPLLAPVEEGGPESAWDRARASAIGAQRELFALPLGLDRNAALSLERTVNVDEEAARAKLRGAMQTLMP